MTLTNLSDTQRLFLSNFVIKPAALGDQHVEGKQGEWAKMQASFGPRVEAALSARHPDSSAMRASWAYAIEQGEAGELGSALKAVTRLEGMLTAAQAPVDRVEVPPAKVVAFQRSRIMWIDAKKSMQSDLDKFRNAVTTQCAEDEDKADIMAAVDGLVVEFDAIDKNLEDVLDKITVTPEGPERTKLKQEADKTVGIYLSVFDRPFFKVIDENPFVSVNVTGRAKQSLSVIKATLG